MCLDYGLNIQSYERSCDEHLLVQRGPPFSYRQGADPRRKVGGARMSDPPVNRVIAGDQGERVIAQRIGPVTHCLCMFERHLSLEGGVLFPC